MRLAAPAGPAATPVPVLLLAALVLLVATIAVLRSRNRLVRLRNQVSASWGQIDAQLVRRHDLVPRLVAAVRGYLTHEREVIERVVRATDDVTATLTRPDSAGAGEHSDPATGRVESENQLSHALAALTAVVEAAPELKGSGNVLRLQEDLVSTENRIAFARQHHHDTVMLYNTACANFPQLLVARACGFRPAPYLDLDLSSIS